MIEASDIVLEVLDARDPLGCRCPQVEEAVIQSGCKKLVLVLNKSGEYRVLFIFVRVCACASALRYEENIGTV